MSEKIKQWKELNEDSPKFKIGHQHTTGMVAGSLIPVNSPMIDYNSAGSIDWQVAMRERRQKEEETKKEILSSKGASPFLQKAPSLKIVEANSKGLF